MSVWSALAGGFPGTLVLTTVVAVGNELRLTRMDISFLLGTAVTDDRTRYYAGFVALGRAGRRVGLAFARRTRRRCSRPRASCCGQTTPLLIVVGHLAYGAIVGAFVHTAMR